MRKRKIGTLEVSAIGLGCMGMSIAYGKRDEAGSVRTLHHALDRGVNFIDTADIYGDGHNEQLIGNALKGRRHEMILATKFANTMASDGSYEVRADPAYVLAACHRSLRRLETDVIDLYYLHRIDPKVPIEETVGAMKTLVEQGKVRHIGLSEASASTIRRAHAVHRLTAIQTEYSLWTRDVEAGILPACRELGIGFVSYSPLGRGFLTGLITGVDSLADDDRRRAHPRFFGENISRNLHLLDVLRQTGDDIGATPAQIALAWVLSKGPDIVPIPGTKKVGWLDENIAATELELPAELVATLEERFVSGAVSGERYPPKDLEKLDL